MAAASVLQSATMRYGPRIAAMAVREPALAARASLPHRPQFEVARARQRQQCLGTCGVDLAPGTAFVQHTSGTFCERPRPVGSPVPRQDRSEGPWLRKEVIA